MLLEKRSEDFAKKARHGGSRAGSGRKKGGHNIGYSSEKVAVAKSVVLPAEIWEQLEDLAPGQSATKSAAFLLKNALNEKQKQISPQILDVCCGGRMFYYNKDDRRVLFLDKRQEKYNLCDGRTFEVKPSILADFKHLPFDDNTFSLVIFDPPHLVHAGENSWIRKKYGILEKDWRKELHDGFIECWRVLKYDGTLIFKWNETNIGVSEVLECFSERPILGHRTTNNLKTHWIVFHKSK